jgi:hypothetical protein
MMLCHGELLPGKSVWIKKSEKVTNEGNAGTFCRHLHPKYRKNWLAWKCLAEGNFPARQVNSLIVKLVL